MHDKVDALIIGSGASGEVGGSPLAALVRVVLLCYYRDDRVMRSLGQEPRPPFPKGHVVEQGDWSLLDPSAPGRRCTGWATGRKIRRLEWQKFISGLSQSN